MSSALCSKAAYNGFQMPSQTLRLRSFSGWLAAYGVSPETLVITSSVLNKSNMCTCCNSASRLQIFSATATASGTGTTVNEQRRLSKSGTATVNGEDGHLLGTNEPPDSVLERQTRPKTVGLPDELVRTADSRFSSHNDRNTTNTLPSSVVETLASASSQHQNQSIPSLKTLSSVAPRNITTAALQFHPSNAGATIAGKTSHRIDASAAASTAASDSTVVSGHAAASETGSSPATPLRRHLPLQATYMRRARRPARGLQPSNGAGNGSVDGKRTALTAAAARDGGSSDVISVQADGGHFPPASWRAIDETALPGEDECNTQTRVGTAVTNPGIKADEYESMTGKPRGGSAAAPVRADHLGDTEARARAEHPAGGGRGGGGASATRVRKYCSSERESVGNGAYGIGRIRRTHNPIRSGPGQIASSRTNDISTPNIYSSTRCRSVSRSSASGNSINTSNSRMPVEDSSTNNSSTNNSSTNNNESGNGGNDVPQDPKAQVQGELPRSGHQSIRARQVTKAATAAAAASSSSSDSSSSLIAAALPGNGRHRAFHQTPAPAAATSTGSAAPTAKRTSDDVSRITKNGNRMPRISVAASSSRTATEMLRGSGRSRAFTATAGDGAASSSSSRCSSSWAPGSKGPYPRTSRRRLHPGSLFSRGVGRNAAQQQRANPWSVRCTPIDMEATYPSLASFAAAVRSPAASGWHPLVISAALNHATKMMETLDRRKMPPELQEGIASVDRWKFDRGDERAANPSSRDTASPPSPSPAPALGSNSREGLHSDEKFLRETFDILYDTYLPYVRTTINSRYVINALWVCAKTGYWGPPGHGLVPALLARLRQDNYSLLCRSDGQAHGILWWALSQYDAQQQQQQQQKSGAVAVAALRGKGQAAVADGSGTANE
ncbi:hypothetical protein VaNZ11_012826, partial [Volvox africanus]